MTIKHAAAVSHPASLPALAASCFSKTATTAVCADGSPAWFHIAANASSSDYLFYLQGRGAEFYSCAHEPLLCAGFFSEEEHDDADLQAAGGLLSGDPSENPLYSTFNRVVIPYCSMDMFLLDTQSDDGELQFRGRRLLQ